MRNLNPMILAALFVVVFAGAAPAAHDDGPNLRDMPRVRSLANDLDRQASDWLDALNRRHRFPPGRSNSILNDAVHFRAAARDFRLGVERNMRQPNRTAGAYEKLYDAHQRVVARWNPAHFGPRSDHHARRVDSLMSDLGRYYPYAGYSRVDWNRLRLVSREIDTLADRVYSQARRELGSGRQADWWRRDTLNRLDDLQKAARQFRRQADTSRPDYSRVRTEYERLADSYRYASTRSSGLSHGTRRDFQRVGMLLNDVDRMFDPYRGPRWASDVPMNVPTGPGRFDPRPSIIWGSPR